MRLLAVTAVLLIPTTVLAQAGRVEKKIDGYDKPVLAFVPNTPNPGLILAFHGTGGSGPAFARGFPIAQINAAGYIVAFPTSNQGAWATYTSGGTPEDLAKELKYGKAILEAFVRDYNVHPDKIHLIGYSAGSVFSCEGAGMYDLWKGFKIRSICAHSGGLTGKCEMTRDRAKETSVWVLNGTADTGHAEPSKNMCQCFKDAGYEAKYQEIQGAGHIFPLVPFSEILSWWQSLDKNAPDYSKIQAALKKGDDEFKKGNWGAAHLAYEDARNQSKGKSERLSKSAEEGLAKVKEKANALIDEAASLKDPAKAKKQLQDLVKKFAKTPYAESVQKLLDELK